MPAARPAGAAGGAAGLRLGAPRWQQCGGGAPNGGGARQCARGRDACGARHPRPPHFAAAGQCHARGLDGRAQGALGGAAPRPACHAHPWRAATHSLSRCAAAPDCHHPVCSTGTRTADTRECMQASMRQVVRAACLARRTPRRRRAFRSPVRLDTPPMQRLPPRLLHPPSSRA